MKNRKPAVTLFRLGVPRDFSFWPTVISHGWCELQPFALDRAEGILRCVLTLSDGRPVACALRGGRASLAARLVSAQPISPADRTHLIRQVRNCLRLDESLLDFFSTVRKMPRYRWIAAAGAGRLLRAPTVFEDVVKMLCTTNCSWGLTVTMVNRLVVEFGREGEGGIRAFPEPAAIAASSESVLRRRCTTGYRAPYILEFAGKVASGTLRCEEWRTSSLPTDDLEREIGTIRGVGPYAAGNLLKLLGRYERLGLDSWVRGRYSTLHARGRPVTDRRIERHYSPFGNWRGLIFWLEMTRHWHEDKFPGVK